MTQQRAERNALLVLVGQRKFRRTAPDGQHDVVSDGTRC